jgi:tetratricopeptide (TPR) repeat protein
MDALGRRKRILESVRALSLRGATLRPIVFVFEDLHWIDSSSEEYLASLVDSVAGVPIMVVLTYRVGYTPSFVGRSFVTALTLRPLSTAETLTMAGRVLGTEQFPTELRAAVMEKAEGVPLFVEEVTKTLLDLGVLRRENGGYRMVKRIDEVSVPETIQGIIMARLDRLGEDGKRTVQLASVIGRQFLKRLLERIAGLTDQMEGLLAELKALEIIYEQGLLPEPAYIFKHAVIQDVAYQSLLVQRRKVLHRAVGNAIEELFADRLAEHHEELAHHFLQGEEWAKAFEYLLRSGDKARDAYANGTALDFYARAVEAAAHAGSTVSTQQIMEVHQRRGRLLSVLARFPEAIAELEKMLAMAQAAGDRRGEGQASAELALVHYSTLSADHVPHTKRRAEEALAIARETGDQHVLARSHYLLGTLDQVSGDLVGGNARFEESLRIGERHGFKDIVAADLTQLGIHANWRGSFKQALDLTARSAVVAAEVHDRFHEGLSIAVACLAHVALGEYAEGRALIQRGLVQARERGLNFNIGRLTNTLGWLHQELGDFRSAIEYDREGADLGQRYKLGNVEVSSIINLGSDYVHLGEPRRAITVLEETQHRIETAFGAHRWRWAMRVVVPLAEALIAIGEAERSLPHLERGLARAQAAGCMKYVARIHLLRGDVVLRAGQPKEARADLEAALRAAREIAQPTLTWQAAHLLGRALAAGGDAEAAYGMLTLAVETIDGVAARAPEQDMARAFAEWPRVQAVRDDFEALRRG